MDPEVLLWMQQSMQAIIDQGGTESDVLGFLKSEGINSREEWIEAQDVGFNPHKLDSMVGETTPAIPEGNALGDVFALLGDGILGGVPRFISETVGSGEFADRLDFLGENHPNLSTALSVSGTALPLGAASGGLRSVTQARQARQAAQAAARARQAARAATMASRPHLAARTASQFAQAPAGVGAARTARQGLLELLKNNAGKAALTAGGGAAGGMLQRLLGN